MPAPSGLKYEIEFTAGVFTDVTSDVDAGVGHTVTIGRTSPTQQPQPGQASLRLRNPTGKYTPGVQILSDGTAGPYYPNVQPRKRLRISNSSGVQFLGYIKAWSPILVNGVAGYCQITATDRMDQLSRVIMDDPLQTEYLADSPAYFWPLTDVAGSTTAVEASGNNGPAMSIADAAGQALTFGSTGPNGGAGGVTSDPASAFSGQYLNAAIPGITGAYTFEAWVNLGTDATKFASSGLILSISDQTNAGGGFQQYVNASSANGNLTFFDVGTGNFLNASANYIDGKWHHVAWSRPALAGLITLRVDGSAVGTFVTPSDNRVPASVFVEVGGSNGQVGGRQALTAAGIAVTQSALSSARIAAHYQAGAGWPGETTGARAARFLQVGGLSSSDWNIDTSTVTCGTYPQSGKDVLSACQDMAATEGDGSVFYVTPDGKARFTSRNYRLAAAPVMTISATGDIDGGTWTPSLDDQNLANQSTATRATQSGGQSTQTASDAASIAAYGLTSQDVTTYTSTDLDALNLAQSIVAAGKTPGWRLPRVTVDLLTADANLYATVQNIQIGSRIRVNNIPAGQAPATQLDVIVEGWTQTVNINQYEIAYDCSPADNPPEMIWNDSTYGRWQANADCVLNAAITNVATTVVIKSPTAPTFTTSAGDYPMLIQVDAEIIQLNSAPGGSSSPQTFTGCTRHVNGTSASAHVINSPVTIYQPATWGL